MGKFIDLTGQQFGMLTVLGRAADSKDGKVQWVCRCDCGNEIVVRGYNLHSGNTQSCGCTHGAKRRKKNLYEHIGDVVIGYTQKGVAFFIDAEDLFTIEDYCWGEAVNGYLCTNERRGTGMLLMHRVIMKASDGEIVDHINHDLHDNRKCNLRKVSKAENLINSELRSDNKSGIKGVSWDIKRKKWVSEITYERKKHYLGRFDSFNDAVAARKAAEEKYFGPYSYDNSIAAVPRVAV